MSKKSKKFEEELTLEQSAPETAETPVEEIVATEEFVADDKKANKEKKSGGVGGLVALKAILYVLTFPVIILLAFLICYKMGSDVPFYSFWPYVGVIIVGLFALIFLIVALIVYRKRSKRNIMQKTASLLICCLCLTGVFGLLMDVALPDVIADLTSGTVFLEDEYNNYDSQAETHKGFMRQFIRLNLLNGNYSADYAYDTLKAQVVADSTDADKYASSIVKAENGVDDILATKTEQYRELYNWIYDYNILLDYDYAFSVGTGTDGVFGERITVNPSARQGVCMAITDKLIGKYGELCEAGFTTSGLGAIATTGDPMMTWLFNKNYAAMNQDGYNPINDDCGLGYATANRMTIPVVVRIILNEGYTYTQPVLNDSDAVESYEGYLSYLYKPEIAEEYEAAGNSYDKEITAELSRSEGLFTAADGKNYYVYSDGHVETVINWCVLDMLGDPMPLTSLDLSGLLGDLTGTVLPLLGGFGAGIEDLLNNGLTDGVIAEAADGQKLYLHLYLEDNGNLAITLIPAGIGNGYLGYMQMSWTQMNPLLITIAGLISTRNLLYIFGAVSLVLIFAIGVINENIKKKKDAAKADAESEEIPDAGEPQPEFVAE